MAKGMTRFVFAFLALVGVCNFWQPAFVAPAGRPGVPMATVAAGASALAGAQAAHADPVEDAARKFAQATYPIFQQVDWVKSPIINKWLSTSSTAWSPTKIATAADAVLQDALAMDPALIMAAVKAHDKALDAAVSDPKLLAPLPEVEETFVTLARMIGSGGAEKSQAVYDAVAGIGGANLQQEFYSSVNPADAAEAYKAFLDTVQAVRR